MVTKKNILFILITVFLSTTTLSADSSIALELADVQYIKDNKGQIKPTSYIGDSFRLKVIVSGDKKSPNNIGGLNPSIKGLENFKKTGKADHSTVSISNSIVSAKKVTTYTLSPIKKGDFIIGPATLTHNGKTHTSNIVSVHVSEEKKQKVSPLTSKYRTKTSNPSNEYEIFCKLKADKKEVFVEEPITLTVAIHKRGSGAQIKGLQQPNFTGCTVKEISKTNEYKTNVDGKMYFVIEKKYTVYPSQEGTLSISPAQVIYHVRKKRRTRSRGFFGEDFFSDFFDMGIQQKSTASNTLTLKIKKIPPHTKKADSIGEFSSFSATVDKKNVVVNEPIKLTLSMYGNANLDLILKPELNLHKSFKSYDSKTTTNEVSKHFEYILQAAYAGTWTIAPQEFTYFDTKTKKYKTLKTKPIEITATMPEGEQSIAPVNNQDVSAPKTLQSSYHETDIHFIQEDVSASQKKKRDIPLIVFLLLLLIIPCIIFLKQVYKYIPLASLTKYFVGSQNTLAKYESKLQKIIEENKPEKFYNLFIQFFAEHYKVKKTQVNESWIHNKLLKEGLDQEKVNSFMRFLNKCAQFSFAGSTTNTHELENFAKKANYWLITISNCGLNPPVEGN